MPTSLPPGINTDRPDVVAALVDAHLHYVPRTARMMYPGLAESLYEELESAGNLGLVYAAFRFDTSYDRKFLNYALFSIRSRIAYQRKLQAIQDTHEKPLLDEPLKQGGTGADGAMRHSDLLADDNADTAGNLLRSVENGIFWEKAFALCRNEREREVLRLFYIEDVPKSEIALRLGLSLSRVRQMHDATIKRLRESAAIIQRYTPSQPKGENLAHVVF